MRQSQVLLQIVLHQWQAETKIFRCQLTNSSNCHSCNLRGIRQCVKTAKGKIQQKETMETETSHVILVAAVLIVSFIFPLDFHQNRTGFHSKLCFFVY